MQCQQCQRWNKAIIATPNRGFHCVKNKSPILIRLVTNFATTRNSFLDLLSKGGYEVTSASPTAPSFMSLFSSALRQMARNMKTQEIHRNGNVEGTNIDAVLRDLVLLQCISLSGSLLNSTPLLEVFHGCSGTGTGMYDLL